MSADPIPYGRQTIEDDDIEAVVRALRSEYLTCGPEVAAFEQELADVCGARFAVAVANGTAALHAAYAAAGLGPGTELVTSPLTFSATANVALALGATVRFADVDETLCLDPAAVEAQLSPATRVVTPVDFAGHPAAMDRFAELGRQRAITIVEDAAHALGSRRNGRAVGSLATMTTFSFHPVKTITTAEGGAVLTDDAALAQRLRDFRSHGLVRDADRLPADVPGFYYEIQSLGLNYRITDLQCALGRSQLRKLDRFAARRAAIVAAYRAGLADVSGIALPVAAPSAQPVWHLFTIRVLAGSDARRQLYEYLRERRILSQVHYLPVNGFPLYRGLGFDPNATPNAARAAGQLLSLPLYPALTDEQVARVVDAVRAWSRSQSTI